MEKQHMWLTAGRYVSSIDTATNTVTDTVKVGSDPYGVAISPDGKMVYVANSGSNNISIINTDANTVTATVPLGNQPEGIAITPDGKKRYMWRTLATVVRLMILFL